MRERGIFVKHQIVHLGFDLYHKAIFAALYFHACFSFVRLGQIFLYFTGDVIKILEILTNIISDQ